jgi:AcrR family transcriptional regulator
MDDREQPGTGQPVSRRTRPHRSETRRKVLDAAFAVFAQRGIAASSLTEVAAAAGLTKGAVYSNFDSKDDLVLALMEEHAAARIDASFAEFGEPGDTITAIGSVLVNAMRTDAAWHRLLAEYFAMAHHDPRRQDALRQRRREIRDTIARALQTVAAELDFDLPLPAAEFATVLLALSNGLAVETDIDPDGVPADLLGRVLNLIAGEGMSKLRDASLLPEASTAKSP